MTFIYIHKYEQPNFYTSIERTLLALAYQWPVVPLTSTCRTSSQNSHINYFMMIIYFRSFCCCCCCFSCNKNNHYHCLFFFNINFCFWYLWSAWSVDLLLTFKQHCKVVAQNSCRLFKNVSSCCVTFFCVMKCKR